MAGSIAILWSGGGEESTNWIDSTASKQGKSVAVAVFFWGITWLPSGNQTWQCVKTLYPW